MERSLSQDIREEREELREAAESTLNAIVDLNLDGTIRWASPSWTDVVGTRLESLEGLPMSGLVASENKTVFSDVVESMKRDDSKSHRVHFAVQLGPLSKLRSLEDIHGPDAPEQEPQVVDLEAQGIMVYDSVSGGESHVSFWSPDEPLLVTDMYIPDNVDDPSLDRTPRDSNRPPRRHCRFPWLRC